MELTWIHGLRKGVGDFLVHQRYAHLPGASRFSYSGDLFTDPNRSNLAGSIFALKLYHLLDERDPHIIEPIAQRILSFQRPDGTFVDPFVWRNSLLCNSLRSLRHFQLNNLGNREYVRAETRQSISALLLYNYIPPRFPTHVPTSPDAVDRFLHALDWSLPWGAGSHASHLFFFLSLIHRTGTLPTEAFLAARQAAVDFLAGIQHESNGAWYAGQPSHRQKVNGAMKVITGLIVDDLPIPFPERLIDLCLTPDSQPVDACDQVNQMLVLRYAHQACGHTYRRDEIATLCSRLLEDWRTYFHPDKGGFSFYRHRANSRYYGARVSRGLDEPDIHGTVLFLWGLSLMNQLVPLPGLEWLQELKS